jgi:hypothetical protein
MRVYQPRSNLVKDENGDLLADSHHILNSWKNCFFQLLIVHRASDVKLKLNSVALVRKRTIPTERAPLVGEVSAKFCR